MTLDIRTVDLTLFGQTHTAEITLMRPDMARTNDLFAGKIGRGGIKTYPAHVTLWIADGKAANGRPAVTDSTGQQWYVSTLWHHRNRQGRVIGWHDDIDWTADKHVW